MKYKNGDNIDNTLTTVLMHEFIQCKDSFGQFAYYAGLNIMGKRDKLTKIRCHDAYTRFLSHLYEFYVGCIKKDKHNLKKLDHQSLDQIFNAEVRKLLHNKIHAIENGYAPSWENHISFYQVEVPEEFGTQFRYIRNRTVHVSIKRADPNTDFSLADFYNRYHNFVCLLYYTAQWLWITEDIEKQDWKAIEEFDLFVQRSHS
jgi:hypothetical protein